MAQSPVPLREKKTKNSNNKINKIRKYNKILLKSTIMPPITIKTKVAKIE
jgi:hypothetical protein